MKIYTDYKVPVFRTNFLKLKFWKLLSNPKATFNLEKVNLLGNPNINPKNGVSCKKACSCVSINRIGFLCPENCKEMKNKSLE